MQPNPPAPTHADVKSLVARIGWLTLILATLYLCYFSHLGTIGLVGPDEPRYAWIARAMAETGDWITPRLYGNPWFEKPPLYYWGAALSFKLFGVSEATARLPSAIAALLATLALAWLALRLYGAETARWLLLLLPTTVGMIGFAHAAATDMPFSAMLTIAMVAAGAVLGIVPRQNSPFGSGAESAPQSPLVSSISSTYFAVVVFGFFLGLAVLAKGPAGIILCGGAVFFWAFITKRWRDALRLFHPAGIAAFCATALPWYILCARRNPEFFRIFVIEHNFKRFLTSEFQHIQPFWYYTPVMLVAFLPWTAALLWALLVGTQAFCRKRPLTASTCFFLCWAAFCVAFFSISRSKLPGYILPTVPAIAVLVARSAVCFASAERRSFGIISVAASVFFTATLVLTRSKADSLAPLWIILLLAIALANFLLGVFFLFSRRNAALVAAILPILLAFALLDDVLPFTPISVLSPRYLADQLQANQVPLADLRVVGIKRNTLYGLNFYLRTDLQEWDRDPARESYVLATGRLPCSKISEAMSCSNLWGRVGKIDDFELLHLTPKR